MSETSPTMAAETDVRPLVRAAGAGNRTLWLFAGALALGGCCSSTPLMRGGRMCWRKPQFRPHRPGHDRRAATAQSAAKHRSSDELLSRQPAFSGAQSGRECGAASAADCHPRDRAFGADLHASMAAHPSSNSLRYSGPRGDRASRLPELAAEDASSGQGDRVTASRLLNPSLTVPQGTIAAAVLETALDSTRPGAVRAIVSRDARSFDGSKVLIPRGSRLYEEYASDLSAGQKRALVIWHRLTRPDAVIIDMGSPAADPLGRAGIGGKVDTAFLRALWRRDPAVGARHWRLRRIAIDHRLSGHRCPARQHLQQMTRQQSLQVQPTLKVQQGASVSGLRGPRSGFLDR